MPKRVVDGPGIWLSHKLRAVFPVEFRAEFANLIPLAMANGVFECDPDLIWSTVYSFNRPDWSRDRVEKLLDEYARVKLLFRWQTNDNKIWGFWVGITKPGRLPSASRLNDRHEKLGPEPPKELLENFLSSTNDVGAQRVANGYVGLGFGSGFCLGEGEGVGMATQKPVAIEDQNPNRNLHSRSNLRSENGQGKQISEALAQIKQFMTKHDLKLARASKDGQYPSTEETITKHLIAGVNPQTICNAITNIPLDNAPNPSFEIRDNLDQFVNSALASKREREQTKQEIATATEQEQARAKQWAEEIRKQQELEEAQIEECI